MWSRVTRTALGVLLVVVLGGCGDDEPTGADGTPQPTSSSSDAPSPAPSEAADDVEPATGQLIEINALTMRLFEADGWIVDKLGTSVVVALDGFDQGIPGAFSISGGGLASSGTDLEINAEVAVEAAADDRIKSERVANRVINGVECYVLEGADDTRRIYIVGGNHGGYLFDLEFEVPVEWPGSDELIESMLASIEWK